MAAASSDGQVLALWQNTKPGLDILRHNPASLFQRVGEDGSPGNLLDLDEGADVGVGLGGGMVRVGEGGTQRSGDVALPER